MASLRWKCEEATTQDHQDVLEGMKQSNGAASKLLSIYELSACTDVTGYGLLGHLHEILHDSNVAANIYQSRLLSYKSLDGIRDPYKTQQFHHNRRYVDKQIKGHISAREADECHLFDAQVSGGLLYAISQDQVLNSIDDLSKQGYSPFIVGEVVEGQRGKINLVY